LSLVVIAAITMGLLLGIGGCNLPTSVESNMPANSSIVPPVGGTVGQVGTKVQTGLSDFQKKIADPNSGINKAADVATAGVGVGQAVLTSPAGALVPEPFRSIALGVLALASFGLAGYQTTRKKAAEQLATENQAKATAVTQERNLAVTTLGTVVNAVQTVENTPATEITGTPIDMLKGQIQSNQIAAGIYPAAKTLIQELKKPIAA
jgi:hypothetical protein